MDNDQDSTELASPSLLGVRGNSWKVTADHPIFARPDKANLSEADAKAYADSLRPLGFENISVTSSP